MPKSLLHVFLIARREYLERVRAKSFLVMTVLIPTLMGGVLFVMSGVMGKSMGSAKHLAVITADPRFGNDLQQAFGTENGVGRPTVDVYSPSEPGVRARLDRELKSKEANLDGKLPSPARLARFVSQASSVSPSSGVPSRASYPTASSSPSYTKNQPFRAECALVAHTFLGSHAPPCPMALNIPSDLLDATLAHLSQTTHPSVFHPVYQLSYEMLQTSSLPFFLAEATPNINREKQLYWWLYGAFTFLLGWAVTIGCLFIYKNENERQKPVSLRQRAWRLWAVPLLSLGGMQMYSAYRGYAL